LVEWEIGREYLPLAEWLRDRRAAFTVETLAGIFTQWPADGIQTFVTSIAEAGYFRILWYPVISGSQSKG
jgi:hypothetical protein